MPSCEMCGYIGESFHRAIVEGTLLSLCDKCVRFGEVVQLKQVPKDVIDKRLEYYKTHRYNSMRLPPDFSGNENIVRDYAQRVRNAREKTGKTHRVISMRFIIFKPFINYIFRNLFQLDNFSKANTLITKGKLCPFSNCSMKAFSNISTHLTARHRKLKEKEIYKNSVLLKYNNI